MGEWASNVNSSVPRGSPQRRDIKVSNVKTTPPIRTRVRSRAGPLPAPVTEEDLRAMAQYLFEKRDDGDIRRYNSLRWREFAQRPEVSIFSWMLCVRR